MAITTLDGIIAGMQQPAEFTKGATGTVQAQRAHSIFYNAGIPVAASAPAGISGTVLTSYTGQMPFTNPTGGKYTYLARFQASTITPGTLLLCDRLWHNGNINITSTDEQTFTGSAQIPPRDANGTSDGVGVYAGVEVSSQTGAGTPILVVKYTNSFGVPDKSAVYILSTSSSSPAGTFYQIGLSPGDLGIQKAQSLTLTSTWTSGTIHVVLYRVLARLEIILPNTTYAIDALNGGFVRAYDNTVPFLIWMPSTVAASNFNGHVIWTQG